MLPLRGRHRPYRCFRMQTPAETAKPSTRSLSVTAAAACLFAQAAQRAPTVGHIVGALWELRDLAAVAKGNHANCATLDAFGVDILRAFDFQGALFH